MFVQAADLAIGLDAATGAVLWQRPVRIAPAPPPTTLLARDGRLYLSEVDSVMALDGATGRTLWAFHPDSQAVVEPALDATTLYTGQRGVPVVYALDRADGALRWRTNLGVGYQYLAYVRGVAVSGDTVYAALTRDLSRGSAPASGVLVALDRRDGHELWRYEVPGDNPRPAPADTGLHSFVTAPLSGGRLVVVADDFGRAVLAPDPVTQRLAWRTPLPADNPLRTILHDGTVYVSSVGGAAYAIDAATGALRWRAGGFGSATGGAYCGGSFFINDQRLQRLDATTGKQTGHLAPDRHSDAFTSDLVDDGTRVYFTGSDGAYAVACQ